MNSQKETFLARQVVLNGTVFCVSISLFYMPNIVFGVVWHILNLTRAPLEGVLSLGTGSLILFLGVKAVSRGKLIFSVMYVVTFMAAVLWYGNRYRY